jgi:hypothetical protein
MIIPAGAAAGRTRTVQNLLQSSSDKQLCTGSEENLCVPRKLQSLLKLGIGYWAIPALGVY